MHWRNNILFFHYFLELVYPAEFIPLCETISDLNPVKSSTDPHQNVNSVTAGQLSRPVGHMSSTVQCSEINGETVCRRRQSASQNSFGIGKSNF